MPRIQPGNVYLGYCYSRSGEHLELVQLGSPPGRVERDPNLSRGQSEGSICRCIYYSSRADGIHLASAP
jgi:hypothetical protein